MRQCYATQYIGRVSPHSSSNKIAFYCLDLRVRNAPPHVLHLGPLERPLIFSRSQIMTSSCNVLAWQLYPSTANLPAACTERQNQGIQVGPTGVPISRYIKALYRPEADKLAYASSSLIYTTKRLLLLFIRFKCRKHLWRSSP